jgi:hypothetical protein
MPDYCVWWVIKGVAAGVTGRTPTNRIHHGHTPGHGFISQNALRISL